VLGDEELVFDRSPDFFARHRLQEDHRIVVAELDGEIVGVEAAAVHEMRVGGTPRRMTYINHSRIRPDAQGHGVAAAVSAELMAWGRDRGAEGPYWYISPANARSIRFGGRGGGRWPADVILRTLDGSAVDAAAAAPLEAGRMDEAIALINATHEGKDLYVPHTGVSFARRLSHDPGQYGATHLRGVVAGGRLVAVAGAWDSGRCMARIQRNTRSGVTTTSRTVSIVDWGYARGEDAAFRALLHCMASEARGLGRTGMVICAAADEPVAPDALPSTESALSLFTPTVAPPQPAPARLFADLIYV
jgi:GNAT superfamily N-acetyltransferase